MECVSVDNHLKAASLRQTIVLAAVVAICGCTKQPPKESKANQAASIYDSEMGRYVNELPPAAISAVEGFALLDKQGKAVLTHAVTTSYDWDTHVITLGSGLREELLSEWRGRSEFTAVADGIVCYDGNIMSSMDSLSANSIVINLSKSDVLAEDQVQVTLGYPTRGNFNGIDKRSDQYARSTLERLGKLK